MEAATTNAVHKTFCCLASLTCMLLTNACNGCKATDVAQIYIAFVKLEH